MKPTDAPAIVELWSALVAYHRELTTDLPAAAVNGAARYAKRLIQRLDDPFTHILVAEDEDRVIGFALGTIVDLLPDIFNVEPGGYLADIFIDPAYRHQGLGRELIEQMINWFREQQVHYIELSVAVQNKQAIAFWKAVGGREVMLRMRIDV
ncbi:MAG TPA: GNAT family N-acetyltransferase [Aggregatilineales bacterium]|nr:GNAT family N-acetyltransferase [Anaerolineae bacterium]HUN05596.1 GNAT family N-acetyltransferase [Aggregatilineales bacterium]